MTFGLDPDIFIVYCFLFVPFDLFVVFGTIVFGPFISGSFHEK